MPGGRGNIRPEDNPKPFAPGQSGNPNGQPPSIKKQIKEILKSDGEIEIKWDEVISIEEGKSIKICLPNQISAAMRLFQWAMSNKAAASIRAIQIITEHLDGKPPQAIAIKSDPPIQHIELTNEQVERVLDEFKPKGYK